MTFVEDCKAAVDDKKVYGAILKDLSKAFDCLPYRLLISKLRAYGLTAKWCMLIVRYFSDRRQLVKIGNHKDSILCPFMFNAFQNDLMLKLEDGCNIYNYADYNTMAFNKSERAVRLNYNCE